MGDFNGTLEKKNALGIWTKKHVVLRGLSVHVADSPGSAPVVSVDLQGISRGGESGDPLLLIFLGSNGDLHLRGLSGEEADKWYNTTYEALVSAGKARPRNVGLPSSDPRNNLKFVDIPPEFATRFINLQRAVLYWFAPVKKYGVPSRITGKCSVEDRVGFCGDKAFYVTKPNSEVTRCIKIGSIKRLFTNVGVRDDKEEPFIVFKMAPPDFDLYIAHNTCETLLRCLTALYAYVNRGQDLSVTQVKQAQDPVVELQLARPAAFEMVMVVPNTKEQLKKALDKFAAKHGLTFASATDSPKLTGASKSPQMAAGGSAGSAVPQGSVPQTDPLGVFLLKLGLGRYYMALYKNSVDFDVLEVMDDKDLQIFGVDDPAAIALIRAKIADISLMEAVRSECDAARAGWTQKQPKVAEVPIASREQPQQQQQKSSPSSSQQAPRNAPPIILSDSDDDLLPPPKAQSNFAIVLDSDDDLELPPPKPKPAAPPITLSDDDL